MAKSHSHGENTRTDAPIVGYLIADDGAPGSIHDEPDVSLDAPDFDVGLIGSKDAAGVVIIVVNKGLNTDGSCFAVIGDLLMGDGNVVQIP